MQRAEGETARNQPGQAATWTATEVELLGDAVRLHKAGKLDEAIASYAVALQHDPALHKAHYYRGIALRQKAAGTEAVASFRSALALQPDDAEIHCILGNLLVEQGLAAEALPHCARAVSLRPDYAQAHANLGRALRLEQRFAEASVCIRRALALDPDLAEARFDLGMIHGALDEPDAAIDCFRQVLARAPDHAEAHYNLAAMLQGLERLDEAVASYRQAVALRPDFVEALVNLGEALRQQGNLGDAAEYLRTVLALNPGHPMALNNLGAVVTEQGRLEEAIVIFRQALQSQPEFPEVQDGLGSALQNLGHVDEAVEWYQRSLALRPEFPQAHNNLGIAMQRLGRIDDAIACFRRTVALQPDYPDPHFHLGMALLSCGEMSEGWQEYEWRWQLKQSSGDLRAFSQPQWHGEPGEGRTLLIHAEQGFGDSLQFCRYAPLAAARGFRVILEVPPALVRLMTSLPGVDQVVAAGSMLPPFDLHCPMLSLPLALGTTLDSIPGGEAYLQADPVSVAAWRERLRVMGRRRLRVGVVWSGDPRLHLPSAAAINRRRSMSPELLAPLFDVPDVQFFSLQKIGAPAPESFRLIDVMGEMRDFADTAALVANLDLVIAVDTAVAHLAGAVGTPVWLLDRFDHCWRWLIGRRDSPWYPALRIYRQAQPGDWAPVVAEAAQDLRRAAEAALLRPLTANEITRIADGASVEQDPVAQIERLDAAVFPAGVAIGHNDRLSLLLIHKLVRNIRHRFRYLEIAARFRGTVVPFLLDPHCEMLITVPKAPEHDQPTMPDDVAAMADESLLQDVVGRVQPDMLGKVVALDCDISAVPEQALAGSVDLALLDATHSDASAFRSVVGLLPLLREGGIVVFEDASSLSAAFDNIAILLTGCNLPYAIHHLPDSVAALSLGPSAQLASAAFRLVARQRPDCVQAGHATADHAVAASPDWNLVVA